MSSDSSHTHSNSSDNSDSLSQTSSTSASRKVLSCPECFKDIQARSFFNHIYKQHPTYLYLPFKNLQALQDVIDSHHPLPVEWTYTDDFDEPVDVKLWGCCSCCKTFTTQPAAITHTKHTSCKTKHTKGLKDIHKAISKEIANDNKKKSDSRQRYINRSNQDIWFDTFEELLVVKNRIFNEYIPWIEKRHSTNSQFPTLSSTPPPLPSISFKDEKEFLLTQEKTVHNYTSKIQSLIKEHIDNLYYQPALVSDDLYFKLSKFRNLYGRQSINNEQLTQVGLAYDANILPI